MLVMYSAPFLATTGLSRTDPRSWIGYDIVSQAEWGTPWRARGSGGGVAGGPSYPFPAKIPVTRGLLILEGGTS